MRYKRKKEYYKKRGLKYFLIEMGIIRIGFLSGFFCLIFYYLYSINFKFQEFSILNFIISYLIWWPLAFIIGIVSAYFMWVIDMEQ